MYKINLTRTFTIFSLALLFNLVLADLSKDVLAQTNSQNPQGKPGRLVQGGTRLIN